MSRGVGLVARRNGDRIGGDAPHPAPDDGGRDRQHCGTCSDQEKDVQVAAEHHRATVQDRA